MKRLVERCRAAWILSVLLAWTLARPTQADPPTPPLTTPSPAATAPSAGSDPDAALQQALELERQRKWSEAIEAYQQAQEHWPSRKDFRDRRRLCELHYRVVRRYQDQSFRNVLLRLPEDKALELYDEILDRIGSYYVDPVPLEPLIRWGLDNMEVCLRDPAFIRTNVANPSPERINRLRDGLRNRRERMREQSAVPSRHAARSEVLAACELARQALGVPSAAVILEFAYGACDALDDYTSYLTPDKLEDLYAMIDGNFVGLGIELKLEKQRLRIVGVIKGGPASEAGLKAGDQITKIGGQAIAGLSLDEAASRLQGTEGTPVELEILHADGRSGTFRMTRRHVEVESVAQARIVEPEMGIGYIQLTGFQKSSTEELGKAIASLQRTGMRTLILDLRGNPGGLLNVAVEIAEGFINQGIIVSTRGRAPGQSQVYRARSRATWTMPMLVLIDRESASASEILAGALKDHGRATVVGQKSYGKGSVQSIFSLKAAPAGLKLTTAKFYSPLSRAYSEQGVDPDLAVDIKLKPNGTTESKKPSPLSETSIGDPSQDLVLQHAINHVRKEPQASR